MTIDYFLGPANHLVGFFLDLLGTQPLLIPHLIFDVIQQVLEFGKYYGYRHALLRFEMLCEDCD